MKMSVEEFVKMRNDALFSFDREKIENYIRKCNLPIPEDNDVFWGGVAKAVLNIIDAPKEAKDKAMAILNGLHWSCDITF